MLQWFIIFPEFAEFTEIMSYLGKTPLKTRSKIDVLMCLVEISQIIHYTRMPILPTLFSCVIRNEQEQSRL